MAHTTRAGLAIPDLGLGSAPFGNLFQATTDEASEEVRRARLPACGGVGLCELVQHLSVFDCVAASGSLEGRVTEFVDHLHEHFVDPCVVVDGRYTLSTEPGCGARMHDASIARYEFPSGSYWRERPIG